MAAFAAGEHGPISVMKEATASAPVIARPGDRGAANALIAELAQHAESKEVRHDVKGHQRDDRGDDRRSARRLAAGSCRAGKLPSDEAVQIGAWLVDIAKAEAEAAKTVNPVEQATIDKIAALFNVTSS